MRYLCGRLGHGLLVLAGVSALTFALAGLAPGSVFDEARIDPRISAETLAAMRDRYRLDRSMADQYVQWLRSIPRGDLGFSVTYDSPVAPLLWPRARNTLLLAVPATVMAWCLAVTIGAWAASRPGGLVDRVSAGMTTVLLSVPDLLLGLGLLLLAVRSGLFPTGGMISAGFADLGPWDQAKDVASHFLLPVAALTLINLPVLLRHVRASLLDVLRAPFIVTARAAGIPERRLLFRHALRAAANPLISLLGLSIATLLSASVVVEMIMGWPGLGPLLIGAVAARDLHLVVGAVLCSTVLLIGGNVLADVLLRYADPRLRAGQV